MYLYVMGMVNHRLNADQIFTNKFDAFLFRKRRGTGASMRVWYLLRLNIVKWVVYGGMIVSHDSKDMCEEMMKSYFNVLLIFDEATEENHEKLQPRSGVWPGFDLDTSQIRVRYLTNVAGCSLKTE
jgi:hypothetical protein